MATRNSTEQRYPLPLTQDDANKILTIDPNNEEAKQELARIVSAQKAAQAKEKKLFGSMFSKSGLYDDKKPKEKKKKAEEEKEDTSEEGEMPELEKDEEAPQAEQGEQND